MSTQTEIMKCEASKVNNVVGRYFCYFVIQVFTWIQKYTGLTALLGFLSHEYPKEHGVHLNIRKMINDVTIQEVLDTGDNPLIIAIKNNHPEETIKMLITE